MSQPTPRADYVRIFDTTLRDGEQSPGATMTSSEKLEVAHMLARLGVDIIEAGFPAASPDDLDAVRTIAETVGRTPTTGRSAPPVVCALARAVESDLEKAWTAVKGAAHPRIHTFLATSPIHREHKLRMSKAQVLDRIRSMVAVASSMCPDIEFSPEDAGRTEPEFLWEAVRAAIAAGATTINIPDTVGYTTPDEFGALIAGIVKNVEGIENVILSVHCHDDLGMATANSLAGVKNGARQVEVTVNGIGERAGNTALEEVVMALATRRPSFQVETGVDSTQIARASRLVSTITGIHVQPNKAIVGANAFAHESGIHQDGMLKHEQTYEILRPEAVGIPKTQLVLGKHSGRHAFRKRLTELGFALADSDIEQVFAELKKVAERKKVFTDADLVALVSGRMQSPPERYSLDGLQIACGTVALPTATVRLRDPDGKVITRAAVGSGPVDACFKAIDEVVAAPAVLLEYAVRAVTEGIDALGEVTVRVRAEEATTARENPQHDEAAHRAPVFYGHGADTDILVASAKAYLAALNRLLAATQPSPRHPDTDSTGSRPAARLSASDDPTAHETTGREASGREATAREAAARESAARQSATQRSSA